MDVRESLLQAAFGLQAVTALLIVVKGLAAPHRALVAYLVFSAAANAWLSTIPAGLPEYLRTWGCLLPIATILSIATGWQAYGRSLETSPQARRLSHHLLLGICAIAATLAQFAQETITPYGVLSRVDQGVSVALGLFCLGMLPLLQHFYSPRRRPNAIAQEWILTIYYLGNALSLLATHWRIYPFNTYVWMATAVACCFGWLFYLTREGEKLPAPGAVKEDDRLEKLAAEAQFDALASKVKSAARSK